MTGLKDQVNRQHLLHRHSVNGKEIYSIYDSISIKF